MILANDLSLVIDVIQELQDPVEVKSKVLRLANAHNKGFDKVSHGWKDLSLANGYPSLLLLFGVLQKEMLIKDDIAYRYVLKIKEIIETEGISDLSIFNGVAGISFALNQASCEGKRYCRMLDVLHIVLIDGLKKKYLDPIRKKIKKRLPIPSYLYDSILGVCGIGRYCLEHLSLPCFRELVENIAKVLVEMCKPIDIHGHKVPGWYISADDPLNALSKSKNVQGNFNLGLAHGITGILAFLSIATLRGIMIEGQKKTINLIVKWIRSKSFLLNSAIRWPYCISFEEEIQNIKKQKVEAKDAWCYGVPGIARTLFLAGKALCDEDLKKFAIKTFRGIFLRSKQEWNLLGPGLCHGVAGLLLITKEMSKEKECADLISDVEKLHKYLLSFYDPKRFFGFKAIEQIEPGKYVEIDKIGFLEGSAGILLTLLSISEHNSEWHLPLLIYG